MISRPEGYQPELRIDCTALAATAKSGKVAVSIALALAVLLSPTAQATEGYKTTYVVQRGDNLWEIAKSELGDANRWVEIVELNGLADGSALAIGQSLKLPK